ncbi:MAG TPA: pilin [Candidatus Saccharimonadales bacterium]|nr:pilin [Candidatus Saccharimonadales bacterium]
MIQKLKSKLLVLSAFIFLAAPFAAPAAALAACTPGASGGSDCIQGGLCSGAQSLQVTAGTATCTEQDSGLQGIIQTVVNILSVIVGVVAVIMIIVGGFRYITSGGKAESITGAKNTILYALIGLVIVALAQIIVRFVLTRVTA